jgi:hypothetical protein
MRVTSLDLALLAVFERPASDWALVGLADLDGDGLTDLLWARDSGELAMTRMAPSLAGSPDFIDAGALGSDEVVLATGDFDGDGSAELLVESSGNGRLAVWNLIAGGAPDARELELLPGVGQVVAGSRDYDADGIDDLLFQGPDGSLTAWLLDSDGVRALAPLGATPGGDVLASGDFDGDGVIDVARLDAAGAVQLLLLGGGLDTPTAVGVLPPVAGLEWAGVGDYDGDGRSDLLWQDAGGSPVVWFIDPDLTAETVTLPVEPDWALVADWR